MNNMDEIKNRYAENRINLDVFEFFIRCAMIDRDEKKLVRSRG